MELEPFTRALIATVMIAVMFYFFLKVLANFIAGYPVVGKKSKKGGDRVEHHQTDPIQ